MTVATDRPSYERYVSDGGTTPRAIAFPFGSAADIVVTVNGAARTLSTHYTITGTYPSAVLTPLSGFAAEGDIVEYWRETPAGNAYSITSPSLSRAALEGELDRSAMALQEVQRDLDRALLLPIGETFSKPLPPAANRASTIVGFDSSGEVLLVPPSFPASMGGSSITYRARVSVLEFGAVGNDAVKDTAAILAAQAYCQLRGGGEIELTPIGKPYQTSHTIILANGVVLAGYPGKNFPGDTATPEQWAEYGSWLSPQHTGDAVVCLGHGSGVNNIGIVYDQPIPSDIPGTPWTPIIRGWGIKCVANDVRVTDVVIVNGSHGISVMYPSANGGGTDVYIERCNISCFVERFRTSCVNDDINIHQIDFRNRYYASNSNVVDYIRTNTKGWRCGYTDNPKVNGLQFFEDAIGIYYEDETCLGNTHSLYNGTMANVQFNLPQVSMKVANATVTATATWSNLFSQTGNAFDLTWADTAFQLASPNVDFEIVGMRVPEAGGVLFDIDGLLSISGFKCDKYSSASPGQVCFSIGANANVRLANYRIKKVGAAGRRFAGDGIENIVTSAAGVIEFAHHYNETTLTCDGSYQDFGVPSYFRPGQSGVHQCRLIGEVYISTPQASGTVSVRLGDGLPELLVSGIPASATGKKPIDTEWVDISEATLVGLSTVGKVQISGTAGVVLNNGPMQMLCR